MAEVATWFGPADQPTMGWLHIPEGGVATGGLVLCPPHGAEYITAHRTLRRLASRLAASGKVVLRFDYPATGDSAGFADSARLPAWLESIRDATELLRAAGVRDVGVIGLRLGAVLAAAAAFRCQPISTLVLWDPVASGSGFLREQKALYGLSVGKAGRPDDGGVETPGFSYSPEMVAELNEVRLVDLDLASLWPNQGEPDQSTTPPVLVLTRKGRVLGGPMKSFLAAPVVEWHEVEGQGEFLENPSYASIPPEAALDAIVRHMVSMLHEPAVSVDFTPRVQAVVAYDDTGEAITEEIVRLGPQQLFGVVTRSARSAGPTVICIGVSTDHHIGPGRLWVDLARDWASRGVPAVRFDREGLGESGSVIGDLPIAYSVGAATDTVEIATAMSPDDVGNVALVGLCSSAWAAAVGVESLVPRAAYLLNTGAWSRLPPLNWFVEDEADPRPAPGSKPTLKTRWHQSSFKRRFKLGMPQPLWHLLAKRGYVDAPELILSGLTEKTQLTLVFGKADYEVFRDHRGPRAVDRVAVPERLRVIRVDAADHALQNGAGRREVREILAELVPKDLAAG